MDKQSSVTTCMIKTELPVIDAFSENYGKQLNQIGKKIVDFILHNSVLPQNYLEVNQYNILHNPSNNTFVFQIQMTLSEPGFHLDDIEEVKFILNNSLKGTPFSIQSIDGMAFRDAREMELLQER